MQPEHASFRQIDSSLEIDRKKIQYGEVDVPKLPFFFGEDSPFCPKSLNLLNQMDESVKGMHLCLGLLSGDWSHPVIEASKIDESTKLGIINYSCSGRNLRLKLRTGRKWLISDDLVF